jgi:hypothetical protein
VRRPAHAAHHRWSQTRTALRPANRGAARMPPATPPALTISRRPARSSHTNARNAVGRPTHHAQACRALPGQENSDDCAILVANVRKRCIQDMIPICALPAPPPQDKIVCRCLKPRRERSATLLQWTRSQFIAALLWKSWGVHGSALRVRDDDPKNRSDRPSNQILRGPTQTHTKGTSSRTSFT